MGAQVVENKGAFMLLATLQIILKAAVVGSHKEDLKSVLEIASEYVLAEVVEVVMVEMVARVVTMAEDPGVVEIMVLEEVVVHLRFG